MELGNNQIVDILITGIESVDGDLFGDLSYSFSTTFDPFYSTPNRVRAIAGSYIKDISDEMLIHLIHKYSVEAEVLAICKDNVPDSWVYYASLWVAYMTALTAIYNSPVFVGEAGQKVYKKLGDFSISKDASGKDGNPAKGLIEKLECEIFKLAVAVKFCKEPLIDCVKGIVGNDLRNSSAAQLTEKGKCLPRPKFGRQFMNSGRHPQLAKYIKVYDRYRLANGDMSPGPIPDENRNYQ